MEDIFKGENNFENENSVTVFISAGNYNVYAMSNLQIDKSGSNFLRKLPEKHIKAYWNNETSSSCWIPTAFDCALVEAPGFDPLLIISTVLKMICTLFKKRQPIINKSEIANCTLKDTLFLFYRLQFSALLCHHYSINGKMKYLFLTKMRHSPTPPTTLSSNQNWTLEMIRIWILADIF